MKNQINNCNSNEFDELQTKVLMQLKGIEINKLKGMDISRLLFNFSGEALRATWFVSIKKLVRTLFFDTVIIEHKKNGASLPLLITYDYHRNDHNSYWKKFKNIIGKYDEMIVDDTKPSLKRVRSPKNIVSVYISYRKARKEIRQIGNTVFCRMTASILADLISVEEKLKSLKIDNQAAFIFFDGGRIENLIVQHLRRDNIRVAAMQHGQPVFHGMDRDRINQTMILNFSSDYIMVTGEFSKKQFMLGEIPEENIFVGGSLREINPIRENTGNDFVVFLDCPTYPNALSDNKELIECAEKISRILDANYVIKCHPQDDPQNYRSFSDEKASFAQKGVSIREVLQNKSFAILHASGVYLDIISEGVKAFCFVNETNFPLVENEMDSFDSVSDLQKKIEIWNSFEADKRKEHMNSIIEYYLSPGNVENRYRNFVDKLINIQKAGI